MPRLAQRPGILKNWNFIRQLVRCLQDEGRRALGFIGFEGFRVQGLAFRV